MGDKADVLYRYAGYDIYSLNHPTEYHIISETKCGWWVTADRYFREEGNEKKWVSKTGKKRLAYPTKEEALVNYVARKRSQILHLKRVMELAKNGLALAGSPYSTQKLPYKTLDGITLENEHVE